MSEFPVFPLFVSDYLADTWELDGAEHGAYLLLMIYYWKQRKGPENDPKTLAKVTRFGDKKWQKVSQKVLPFFEVKDGRLYHKRLEKELKIAGEKHAKRVEAGRKGGEAKASNAGSNAGSNALAMGKQPELYPELLNTPLPPTSGGIEDEGKTPPPNSREHGTNPRAVSGREKHEAQKRKDLERKIEEEVEAAWDELHRPSHEEFLNGVRQVKAAIHSSQEEDW